MNEKFTEKTSTETSYENLIHYTFAVGKTPKKEDKSPAEKPQNLSSEPAEVEKGRSDIKKVLSSYAEEWIGLDDSPAKMHVVVEFSKMLRPTLAGYHETKYLLSNPQIFSKICGAEGLDNNTLSTLRSMGITAALRSSKFPGQAATCLYLIADGPGNDYGVAQEIHQAIVWWLSEELISLNEKQSINCLTDFLIRAGAGDSFETTLMEGWAGSGTPEIFTETTAFKLLQKALDGLGAENKARAIELLEKVGAETTEWGKDDDEDLDDEGGSISSEQE